MITCLGDSLAARSIAALCLSSVLAIAPAIARQQPEQPAEPQPSRSDVVLLEALDQVEAGQIEAAIAKLEELRKTGEAAPDALAVLGGIYLETERPDEALAVLAPIAARPDANPAVLYNTGRAAAALGDGRAAVQYLWRSVQLEPASPARRELGLLLGRFQQFEEAYVALRPWVLANPDDTEARRAAAVLAVQLDRPLEAEELLSGLPADDPGVRLLWGQTLMLKSDPWGALEYLKPLVDAAPAALDDDVRRSAARAYILVGEASSAVELLKGRAENDPLLALDLADAYYQSGDLEQAIATLAPYAAPLASAEPPAQVSGLAKSMVFEYGRLLSTAGRHADALPYLRLAVRLDPERAAPWQALGQALAASGERAEAQAALERFSVLNQAWDDDAASLNQQERDLADPTARELRNAWELADKGKTEEALNKLQLQAEMSPQDPRPPLVASRLLMLNQRQQEALVAADRAVAVTPGNPDAHYQRGAVLMAMGELDEAEASMRRALELDPGHVASLSDLAVLLASEQRDDEARALLRKVLELRPGDELAKQHLERLDQRKGS